MLLYSSCKETRQQVSQIRRVAALLRAHMLCAVLLRSAKQAWLPATRWPCADSRLASCTQNDLAVKRCSAGICRTSAMSAALRHRTAAAASKPLYKAEKVNSLTPRSRSRCAASMRTVFTNHITKIDAPSSVVWDLLLDKVRRPDKYVPGKLPTRALTPRPSCLHGRYTATHVPSSFAAPLQRLPKSSFSSSMPLPPRRSCARGHASTAHRCAAAAAD